MVDGTSKATLRVRVGTHVKSWIAKMPSGAFRDYVLEVLSHFKRYLAGSAALALLGVFYGFRHSHPRVYIFWILAVGWFSLGQFKAFVNVRDSKVQEVEDLSAKVASLASEVEKLKES